MDPFERHVKWQYRGHEATRLESTYGQNPPHQSRPPTATPSSRAARSHRPTSPRSRGSGCAGWSCSRRCCCMSGAASAGRAWRGVITERLGDETVR